LKISFSYIVLILVFVAEFRFHGARSHGLFDTASRLEGMLWGTSVFTSQRLPVIRYKGGGYST
ncbi:hypothetical protein, partial [Vibrio cholerae]|uniref:hypothetical protein n=1 Tax=Vibrio cholerae TaxID=666 RepID=UPI001F5D868B